MALTPLTAGELAKKIVDREDLFLLDVRPEEAFNDWSIEGHNVEKMNIPLSDLEKDVENVKEELPKNKNVYVVCAKGISAQKAVDSLKKAGVENVTYLEGGMTAWSEHLEPVKIGETDNGATIYQFVRLGKGCLSYFIMAEEEAAVVDANRMIDVYKNFATRNNVQIKAVIDTHLHADHISGGKKLADQEGAQYWIPPKDAEEVTYDFQPLEDGKDICLGKGEQVKIHPIYSPGHTIGSTSLIVDGSYLLTGDILFVDSIGRPDLAGKAEDWVSDLRATLYDRYRELPDDLLVLPAHFGQIDELNKDGSVAAKLNILYKENEGLQVESNEQFRHMVTDNLPPQPNSYKEIRLTNMGKENPGEDKKQEMETGPNRCAVS
ncbi:MBL fold metallo-hydrolase [Pseudalkalibacillus caeni]|uniref:MBL fold metallo-hydrolase n=1 Tax=Exobacillus caeni TaxID=2574798 RepID=A0A5R9F8L7_9BACL|nr:MBL fold metallo-hydrolase [Pseudalkalibacillus caeni]TLS38869.1 MBL fold metallo-hydrolase [Pseudalkalibacillus caeni]